MGDIMKLEYIDDILVIYLRNVYTNNIKKLCIETTNKLNKYYSIDLKGFYTINIYIDKSYGTIMEINMDVNDLDYENLDLHIITHNCIFLFEVDDILDLNVDKYYMYNDKYYIDINNIYNIEFVKIIYKNNEDIIKNMICKKIN